MGRRWLAAAVAAGTLALMPGTASALLLVWTLDRSPSTVPANQASTFTLVATNRDLLGIQRIGCLEVDLPPSFVIEEVVVVGTSHSQPWSSWIDAQAVVVHSDLGSGHLSSGDSVTFTITTTPTAPGAFSWPNHAHLQKDCGGPDEFGTALTVTVTPAAPTPTPIPSPTPSPVPTATPKPTASPTPAPTLPLPTLPVPSLPGATGRPPAATPSPTPGPTPNPGASRPGESARPDTSPTPGSAAPGSPGASPSLPAAPGSDALGPVRLAPQPIQGLDGVGVDLAIGDLLAEAHVWSVPAAAIGGPGLLLIVWVALQTGGVLAWIPAVRRMRGDDQDGRRPRRRQGSARG